ncbi:hypothetical protein PPS11_14711 [Pseudomonas putida S11]|nr:hypothetical protein PPS11_14711 [Pseudomonas putida S11]
MAVETDSTRLLCAALMANSFDSNGIIGCTQYSRAKVAKPPLNSASTVFIEGGGAFFDPHFVQRGRFGLGGKGSCSSFHGRVPLAQ